jgi:hypothetical protein
MLVRLPPVLFSLSSLSVSSVKLRILENFTLNLRNSWSLNLRAIENCICGLRSVGRKMRSILRTVHLDADLDSTYHLDADLDYNFLFDADPYPTLHPDGVKIQILASKKRTLKKC